MTTFTTTDFVFPVFGGEHMAAEPVQHLRLPEMYRGPVRLPSTGTLNAFKLKQLYGSAFPIGGGWFLTAGHVVAAAIENPAVALSYLHDDDLWAPFAVTDSEILDCDVGLLRAALPAHTPPWVRGMLRMLEDVICIGYAYGDDPETRMVGTRGFKGHVVTPDLSPRWPSHPLCYELSFAAPRGLSGAPVWTKGRRGGVVGMILGNKSTEMSIFREREVLSGGKEQIIERFEALQLGIAIASDELLRLESVRLGGTLEKHLKRARILKS